MSNVLDIASVKRHSAYEVGLDNYLSGREFDDISEDYKTYLLNDEQAMVAYTAGWNAGVSSDNLRS